jgi:hypothetical protein
VVLPSGAVQEPFVFEMFVERVGQDFRIDVDPTTSIVTVLTSATRLDGDPHRSGSGFSLVFRGPVEPLLPQRIYRLVHDELAAMDVFIVPIGRDEAGAHYEAIFS